MRHPRAQSVVVISPTFNEVENVDALMDGILALPSRFRLIIVDDSSPDGTADVVRRRAEREPRIGLLLRPQREGYGRAVTAGLIDALEQEGAQIVVQMDADGSHDPAVVQELVAAIEGGADMAIGSRYIPGGGVRDWPLHRRLLSRGANAYVHRVLGVTPKDCTAGFRAFRAETLHQCDPRDVKAGDYAFLVEFLVRLSNTGIRIVEIPILFTERRAGRSNLSWKAFTESVVNPWRIRLRNRN